MNLTWENPNQVTSYEYSFDGEKWIETPDNNEPSGVLSVASSLETRQLQMYLNNELLGNTSRIFSECIENLCRP